MCTKLRDMYTFVIRTGTTLLFRGSIPVQGYHPAASHAVFHGAQARPMPKGLNNKMWTEKHKLPGLLSRSNLWMILPVGSSKMYS